MALHPEYLNIGDPISHSPVGPGMVTGYNRQGYPLVNGQAVGTCTRADGAKFGPMQQLRKPDDGFVQTELSDGTVGPAPSKFTVPVMTTQNASGLVSGGPLTSEPEPSPAPAEPPAPEPAPSPETAPPSPPPAEPAPEVAPAPADAPTVADALQEMVDIAQEAGLYDLPPASDGPVPEDEHKPAVLSDADAAADLAGEPRPSEDNQA